MIHENISTILYIVAAITSVVSLQFFFPRFYAEKILKIDIPKGAPTFYFAHWGILVLCLCILMVYAADIEAMRTPVILVVLLEKALLAAWVWVEIKKPYTKQLIPAAAFDTVVSVVFVAYLLGF